MLTLGTTKTKVLDDEWTVITADGSRAAHWEHTVAVTRTVPGSSRWPGRSGAEPVDHLTD